MRQKAFGLDIGASTTKTVWLRKESSGYILQAAIISSTPPKGMISESPLDQEEMAQSVVKIVHDVNIASKFVCLALPENQVYTRVIEIPPISDRDLSSAIYWEAEQYIPVPLKNITLDWQILKKSVAKSNEKTLILLVGAPTTLIERYQSVFLLTGLNIVSIETEILSVVRSLVVGPRFPNTLIVHIGAMSTSLALIKGGMIVFTFTIATGGIAINRAIAADFGFTMEQAEEYKRTYGMSKNILGGKIGQATTPILGSIITEVKKALAFYSEKYRQEDPIMQIVLSGGTARLPGLDIFFAQYCGIESVIANPWKVLASQQVPREVLDSAPEYAVAVGLAMKDYE